MTFSRRHFIQAAGAGALLAGGRVWASSELALPGGATVQTLSDGHLQLPADFIFAGLDQQQLQDILARYGIPDGPLTPEVNVTLFRDSGRVILFDAGAGPSFQDGAGKLGDALDAAGVAPEDVTHVVFTHCHPDHLWGVLDDFDDPLFPEAQHMMGQVEWDYWFDPDTASTIGPARAAMAAGARRRMEVLQDRIALFGDGEEILPGVASRATYGHSPGHMSFEIRSGSESVMVLGDAIGNHHVSFAEPGWQVGADQEPEQAAAARVKLLDQLAHAQMRLVGYHLPGGGIGRAEKDGSGYRFVPGAV